MTMSLGSAHSLTYALDMTTPRLGLWVLAILVSLAAGCSAASVEPAGDDDAIGPDTAEQLDDGKSDSLELGVRAGVTTLWMRKLAFVDVGPDGQPRVTLRGRTSRDLASVHSWVPDDAFGTADTVSQRKFEVVLDDGHEINSLLSGLPISVAIETKTGSVRSYTARMRLVPRLASFSGSSALHPSTVVSPVFVRNPDNPLRYRGTLRSDKPLTALQVLSDEAGDPLVSAIDAERWRFDWTYDGLSLAAFPAGDTIRMRGESSTGPLEKSAKFELRVLSLAFTTKDPYLAWPEPACKPAVAQCIAETAGDDLGACGSYREVARCGDAAVSETAAFAADLSAHLVAWYATYGADVIGMGGNTLEQAQAAVSKDAAYELVDPEDDPYAHDFSTARVFAHPDVVFPGSDRIWYGAYDRASGELIQLYDFE
jgi:hypothetical protein